MDMITEDLGIGIGWFGLYFTAFLALWNGRTPGKRLVGTRVVHLDGEPIAVSGHCYGCTAGQGSSCGGAAGSEGVWARAGRAPPASTPTTT